MNDSVLKEIDPRLVKEFRIEDITNEDLRMVAEEIGKESLLVICKHLGGTSVYIPSVEGVIKASRNRLFLEDGFDLTGLTGRRKRQIKSSARET